MSVFQIVQLDPAAAKWLGFAKQQYNCITANGTKDFYREWTMGDGSKVRLKSYGGTAKIWLMSVASGAVRFTLSNAGVLTATVASGASKTANLSSSGYSNFGQMLVYYASTYAAGRIAVMATRLDSFGNTVNVLLAGYEAALSLWFGKPTICPFTEIVLDTGTFPLIAAGQAKVAADIGAMTFFMYPVVAVVPHNLIVYGPHPTDGTTRYYYADDSGLVSYITDSATTATWNSGGVYNRFNDIFSNAGLWKVDMSTGYVRRVNGRNPVSGATILDYLKAAYTTMYGWIFCGSFGDVAAVIDITGTDWIVLQGATYAYFIRTVTLDPNNPEVKVYVVDSSTADTGGGGTSIHITPLASLTGIGEYKDAYITPDTVPNIFVSFSQLGDFIIASDGTYLTPTKPTYPNAPYPKAKTPQLSAVKGSI